MYSYILIKNKNKKKTINQAYAPTADCEDVVVDKFYEELEEAKRKHKSQEVLTIMGDLNAKAGSQRDGDTVGCYGLGERNAQGDTWVDWCRGHDLVNINTWFQNHVRRLWIWKSPGDRWRNQIDYITINKRFANTILDSKSYPVISMLSVKSRKLKKPRPQKKLQLACLKVKETRRAYTVAVSNRYDALLEEGQDRWDAFKVATTETAQEILPLCRDQLHNRNI